MEVERNDMPLVELLLARRLLSEDQLQITLAEQRRHAGTLEQILVTLGFVTAALLRDLTSEITGSVSVDLGAALPDPAALALIDRGTAQRHHCVPVSLQDQTLLVAVTDVDDLPAIDRLRAGLPANIVLLTGVAAAVEIAECIDRFYGFELSIDGILREIESGEQEVGSFADNEYGHPVVRLAEAILADAVKRGASDIHLEPEAGFMRVRYRIDGVLRQIRSLHRSCQSALTVRLKVIAAMNIAESRAPQDGRLSLSIAGRPIEFRVSSLPTAHGENIVLRVLDKQRGILPLSQLGLSDYGRREIDLMMARPEGLILVTGPTGSGKTTTLYSLLSEISNEQLNIMTMEDPVEYPLPLLRQTSLNEQAGMGFAAGIRAMLRQDPDVLLVGEIRDEETAAMAFRAAMTGHQVYSTLHANSSIAALTRLQEIGVATSLLAGNTIGIVSQRLLRCLCQHCKKRVPAGAAEILLTDASLPVYDAVGCDQCDQAGYRGRVVVTEILRINADIDAEIARGASAAKVLELACKSGFKSLADDAIRRVEDGTTSLAEVTRVIDFTNRVHVLN